MLPKLGGMLRYGIPNYRLPRTKITAKDIDGCIIVVNGKQTKKSAALKDGDEVQLMSPVCGG